MKKLALALMMAVLLLSATSCLLTDTPGGGGGSKNEDLAYMYLIRNNTDIDLMEVRNIIFDKYGRMINIADDSDDPEGKELIFGDTDRDATAAAARAFEKATEYESGDTIGYIIYKATDGSVAVWWNHEDMQSMAVKRFAVDFCDMDILSDAKYGTMVIDYSDYDEYLYKKAWSVYDDIDIDDATLRALKELYAYFDGDAIIEWAASLWEPYFCYCGECAENGEEIACYGGGFYYANSARDYEGFYPDLESTEQLLGIVNNMGAFAAYGSIPKAMTEDMKVKMIAFAQACLDKDSGYFYHPQWGSGIGTARRGRDLGHGISILNWFGAKPKYPTALDRLNGASSTSALTEPLGQSVASAVSKVQATAGLSFEQSLESEELYLEWLYKTTGTVVLEDGTLDYVGLKKNSSGAHTISSATSQIKAAGYLETTLDFFDTAQDVIFAEALAAYEADPVNNPAPTGLWQINADYPMVWGLLKIGSLYSSGNRPIRYEEYAMRACVEAILIDPDSDGGYGAGKQYHMNDVYNCWTAPQRIITSAKTYNPDILPTLYEIAREHAPEMIEISMRRLDKFRQDDGSFGYNFGTSSPTTQGVPVSLGLPEGDVNATALAHGMYTAVYSVLGYPRVNLCDARDGERFFEIISEVVSPTKIGLATEPNDYESGALLGVSSTLKNGSSVDIVEDPTDSNNSVIAFTAVSGSAGSLLKFDTQGQINPDDCRILEMDIYVERMSAVENFNRYFQLTMSTMFMLEFVKVDEDTFRLGANATTANTKKVEIFDPTIDIGQWFTLRIEFYANDGEPIIKVFVDGELIGETDIYYNSDKADSVPNTEYNKVQLSSMKRTDALIYIDNTFFTGINAVYTPSPYPAEGN